MDAANLARSAEVVRQRSDEVQGYDAASPWGEEHGERSAGAGAGAVSVFVSTLRSSVPLQHPEERLVCLASYPLTMQKPWELMSDSAIELGMACCHDPLVTEAALLVRDSDFLHDKALRKACATGSVPAGVAGVLGLGPDGEVGLDPLGGQLVRFLCRFAWH